MSLAFCVFVDEPDTQDYDSGLEIWLRAENEDFTDSEEIEAVSKPQCGLCKEIIKIVDQRVINKKSKVRQLSFVHLRLS